jgi:hypothetical protein
MNLNQQTLTFLYKLYDDEEPVMLTKDAMVADDGTQIILLGTMHTGEAHFIYRHDARDFRFEAIRIPSGNGCNWDVSLGWLLKKLQSNEPGTALTLDDATSMATLIEAALRAWEGYPNDGPVNEVVFRMVGWPQWDRNRGEYL